MDFQDLYKHIDAIFQLQFLPIGKAKVSLWMLLYIGVLVTSLIVVTNRLRAVGRSHCALELVGFQILDDAHLRGEPEFLAKLCFPFRFGWLG